MNIIKIDAIKLKKAVENALRTFGANEIVKFTDLSWLTFDNYLIKGIDSKTKMEQPIGFFYEIIDRSEIPFDFEDLNPDVKKIIRFFNPYEKRIPSSNLYEMNFITKDLFQPLDLFVAVQYVEIEDKWYADLYVEPAEECREFFLKFTEKQKTRRAIVALGVLAYIEQKLQKEKRILQKKMPTPEKKEFIHSQNKEYASQPIILKDISVQYIYEPHETREYTRHCESWGVRGHYRHYKSGKVVYIQPHIKGKGQIKDTNYIIKEDLNNEII